MATQTIDTIPCSSCAKLKQPNKLEERQFGYYCATCIKDELRPCTLCQDSCMIMESIELDDNVICRNCTNAYFNTCHTCRSLIHNNDLREDTNDAGDTYSYCQPCVEAREADGVIHDYSYMPRLAFRGEPWETTEYLGVELEINTMGPPAEHAQQFKYFLKTLGVDKYFFFKRDGSINGGYEIVTHPSTMVHGHRVIPWKQILEWLRKNGARSYESGECGLHVHISKQGINMLEEGKLKLFVSKAGPEMVKFSKRKTMSYCQIEPFGLIDLTQYIQGHWHQDGRRVAINTNTGKGTIEYRLFRGTLNYRRFMASLQMVYANVEFVKEHGSMAIAKNGAWKLFCQWLRKKERYQMLIKYLRSQKLLIEVVSEVKDKAKLKAMIKGAK